jgi:hypothetical protein
MGARRGEDFGALNREDLVQIMEAVFRRLVGRRGLPRTQRRPRRDPEEEYEESQEERLSQLVSITIYIGCKWHLQILGIRATIMETSISNLSR